MENESQEDAGEEPAPRPYRPPPGRLLGIDVGNVRIGLAVCDPDRAMASPHDQYLRRTPERDAEYFRQLVRAERIVGLVVGLPYHLGGEEGSQATAYRAYGQMLAAAVGLPVEFWDERLTTVAAEEMLWDAGLSHKKRKERRDKVAATLILQGYLDAQPRPDDATSSPPPS